MADNIRFQAWFITFNSQQIGHDEELEYALNATYLGFIARIKNKFSYKTPDPDYDSKDVQVLDVKEKHTLEIGDKRGMVHIHGQIEITSLNGMVSLDYGKIQKWLNYQLEDYCGGTYFKAILQRNYNGSQKIKKYMEKAVIEVPKRGKFKLKT